MAVRAQDATDPSRWNLIGVSEVSPVTFASLMTVRWPDERVFLAVAALEDESGGLDAMVALYARSHLLPWNPDFDANYFALGIGERLTSRSTGTLSLPELPPFTFTGDLLHTDIMPSTLVQSNGHEYGLFPVGALRCAAEDRRCGESIGEEVERMVQALQMAINVRIEGTALRV